jgi:hypothetical protein
VSSISFSNTGSADKRLYTAESIPAEAGWCACLLTKPSKETLTIAETWNNSSNAAYIYASGAPVNEAAFLKQLTDFLQPLSYNKAFLWLNDTGNISAGTANYVVGTISLTNQIFTSQSTNILFGGYINLSIGVNCLIKLDDSGSFFTISQGSIGFSNQVATSHSQILDNRIYLSMTDSSLGCFRFGLNFNGATDWKAYDTGLKYFYNTASGINSLSFPLLSDTYNANISFQASLDPVNQLNTNNRERTFLAFNTGNTIFPTGLRTSLGNPLYLQPSISFEPNNDKLPYDIPLQHTALLVFSKTDKANTNANYLLMQGGFHLCSSLIPVAASTSVNLLCGLSGIETVLINPQTTTYKGDLLLFVINQPAYAPVFLIKESDNYTDQPLLSDKYLTAWVSITPFNDGLGTPDNNVQISYQSQPEGSSLYGTGTISTKTSTPLLGFYEPVTAYLQHSGITACFPMAFYGSFKQAMINDTDITQFENKIINPWRKKTIEKAALPQLIARHKKLKTTLQDIPGKPSTTPQGLMVYVDEQNNIWKDLILAKNYKGTAPDPKPEDVLTMDFTDLNPRLQSAFQTNQQFLVISLDKPLPESPGATILGNFNNTIELEGWPFILNVPKLNTYGQYNNVLIFKFCTGTVLDRVQNPAQWTNNNDFNETEQNGLSTLSDWLTAYVKDGAARGNDTTNPDPDFVNFAKMVTDPDWNGILALKADISLVNFPEALQGLLAGIDLSRFNAHHFGINANHVSTKVDSVTKLAGITMDNRSSMFCLIYYVDPAFAPYANDINAYKQTLEFNPAGNFDFKTLMLKVLFENSKIKSFKSYIQLSIYELFGSPVTQTSGRDNILILSGSYEDHNGSPSYTFNGFDDDMIPVENPVFGAVEVSRSNFSTLVPSLIKQQENLVFARFSLWGYLNFSNPPGMDVLSFGSKDTIRPKEGLAYSQLLINMNFSLDTPAIKTFEFNINQISFDIPSSLPRVSSLYNHFPIKLTGMVSGDAESLPAKLDFIPISTPDVSSSGIPSGKWYGLVYDLNLGTPGALAGSAGFKSSMMIAWAVTDGSLFTGIKLPGLSSQSKMLSLQGVLKLDIGSIKLLMAKTDSSSNSATAFLLMMNNITMKFLSKSFPSGGNIDFYLFGDPDTTTQPSSLGWYAAYQKKI